VILIFLIAVIFFLLMISAAARTARRRRQLEDEYAADQQRGDGADPYGNGQHTSPLGSIFDALMTGAATHSYEYDPETGRWVDITDREPQPEPEPKPEVEAPRRRSKPRRQQQSQSPLGGLFGGMGGLGMPSDGSGNFEVEAPDDLANFEDVGGMESLKQEIRDTVGLMLQHPDEAERYGIEWNGILLYGPPGVGKTFFAEAIAGEYGLSFIHVSTGDLVSGIVGGSARNIDKAFETAEQNLPCLLFFDEFDSVAQRRDNTPDQESRRTVNQLLTAIEAHHGERDLLVMAATNSLEHLDPAVIRSGRFDRHIRIDLPDEAARREIFETELDDRPTAKDIDLENLELGTQALLEAIERYGGQDRPTVEHWTWDSLVLPQAIKAQLQQLQAIIEDPESTRRLGVEPPSGLLLAGPPGTGKTTIAKVLAAQARCSFYPLSGADVISKWVGESERNIRQVFERARENRPSIIFIDEIDAIAGRRGESLGVHDSHVNQLLAEIDGVTGQRGVFIIGATNRPDQLDPALLRGGRLSRTIVLGLPDEQARLAVLRLHTARMPTVGVDLTQLARDTEGMSPADLKSLAQEAALAAMTRGGGQQVESVTQVDFDEALRRIGTGAEAEASYV
jgi:transitional endoplasmic reticulum ATPase